MEKENRIQCERYMEVLTQNYRLTAELFALKLIKPNSRVLSLGCGAGREVRYLVKKLHCNVTAIDLEQDYINQSKMIEPNAEYFCKDALNYIKENEFDYIIGLWNLMNYLSKENRRKLIKICYINLKPFGKLILTTTNLFQHWRLLFHNLKYLTNYYYPPKERDYWFRDLNFRVESLPVARTTLIVADKLK